MYQVSAIWSGEKSGFVRRADLLLRPLVRDLGLGEGIRLARIKSQWNTLFREPLSHHMSPCSLSGNELLLIVDSPVWLQELTFYREDILEKLAPYQVRSVRFRLGKVSARAYQKTKREGRKLKTLTTHDRSFIEDAVSNIRDKALQEIVQKTITKAMTAGKIP